MLRVAMCAALAVAASGCSFQVHAAAASGDDVPVDGPPDTMNSDLDGDGIVDTSDNCPRVVNPDQRNHDGDNRGDACDVCPHLASTTHEDSDTDGIGDACDPRPLQAGDTVAVWEGFYPGADLSGWTKAGTWTLSNGFLVQALGGTAYMAAPPTLDGAFIQAAVTVDSVTGGSSSAGVFSGSPDSTQSYGCYAVRNGSTQSVGSYSQWAGTLAFTGKSWGGSLAMNTPIMFEQLLGTANACTFQQGTSNGVDSEIVGPIEGKSGIYVDDAQVHVDYFFAVNIGS